MADRMLIDISTLAQDYSVKTEEETMPDGHVFVNEVWDGERMDATLRAAAEFDLQGREAVYSGLPPCWAIFAVDNVLNPPKSYHVTRYLDNLEAEILVFPIGSEGDEGEIEFKIAEDGDNLYIKLFADDERERMGHNYDPKKLCKVVAPPIPEGKHVHISADGATFVLLSAAKTYAPISKSMSLSFFHDREHDENGEHRVYTCAYTTASEKKLCERRLMYKDWDYVPSPEDFIKKGSGGKF